jgi:RHH-type rel operon transcriptional repressor/antitoxin RelB
MIALRLDMALEQAINARARQMGISKSELVRKSLTHYLDQLEKPSAWETGKDLFGRYASSDGNRASDRKALLKQRIRAK